MLKRWPLTTKLKWFPGRSEYGVRSRTIVQNPVIFDQAAVAIAVEFVEGRDKEMLISYNLGVPDIVSLSVY